MSGWWDDPANKQESGEKFLAWNRNTPARVFCRSLIRDKLSKGSQSIIEIGPGGAHEYRALRDAIITADASYIGLDCTEKFTAANGREFAADPYTTFEVHDINCKSEEDADIVYSQHVLEHLPGLNPALENMLAMCCDTLINVFFIAPHDKPDVINLAKYPLYHNRYSLGHIQKVCEHAGFSVEWKPFPPPREKHDKEMVLIARKNK